MSVADIGSSTAYPTVVGHRRQRQPDAAGLIHADIVTKTDQSNCRLWTIPDEPKVIHRCVVRVTILGLPNHSSDVLKISVSNPFAACGLAKTSGIQPPGSKASLPKLPEPRSPSAKQQASKPLGLKQPASLATVKPMAPGAGKALGVAVLASLVLVMLALAPAAAYAQTTARTLPIGSASVVRAFKAANPNWASGHRGVDLGAAAGSQVQAAAAGIVRWVGTINSVPGISLQHSDGTITTYQPVTSSLAKGVFVDVGSVIGTLEAGHEGCAVDACLHWGVRLGEQYLDPMVWLGAGVGKVRLLPMDTKPRQMPPPGSAVDLPANDAPGLPASGPITSPFGFRTNPISGNAEFHDGVDIGAACASPVHAAATGTVSFSGLAGGYGQRIELAHGAAVGTSYSHLSQLLVQQGQTVSAGQVIGLVGTTGNSTGCHLHFSKTINNVTVDPLG